MRIPVLKSLSLVLALALLAAACSGDPSPEAEAPETTTTTSTTPTTTTTTVAEPTFVIPAATPLDIDDTPLPVDDNYRIGTLDNGLTFMLRSNDTPGSNLDLRLVVNAGSLQQPVGLDGSAHFLEHMMFNGTDSFPANELTAQLQELGIEFGADVNAYTSYDETVYLLGATTLDPAAPEAALDVLREWASRATIDPAQVEDEIGIVRDELRQGRETTSGFVNTRFEEIYTEGTPYEGHLVVGSAELVEATTADTLRDFYDTWYRADNMAVIAVGDLPLDVLEREIRSRFESLPPALDGAPVREEVVIEMDPAAVTDIIIEPDYGVTIISLDIPLPVWDTATVGGERMAVIENAVANMLDARLFEAFQRGDLEVNQQPFVSTFAINRALRYYGTNFESDDLGVALDQFMGQLLLAALEGFTEDDVARIREQLLAGLDDQLATLGSIQDSQHATGLSNHFLQGTPIDEPRESIERQKAVVESLTADELTNFWRWVLESSGPIVVGVGNEAELPSAEELLRIVENAEPAVAAEASVAIDELMTAPAPAEIVSSDRRTGGYSDVNEWTFANGVVVTHQETQISEGTFSVWLESTGGWSALPDPSNAMASVAVDAVVQSGVGPHTATTVQRYLESRTVSVTPQINEYYEGVYGFAAGSDAEDLFALMNLTMTAPRVDDVALRSVAKGQETANDFAETDPDVRQGDALLSLIASGDPRYASRLDQAAIDALDGQDLLDLFTHRFGAVDDLRVAIVGDIEVDEARDLTARYLGTLPTGEDDSWVELGAPLPTTAVSADVELTEGTSDGGLARWDIALGTASEKDAITTEILGTIINNRITDTIREELAASYGGSATVGIEREGPTGITSYIQIDGDPARLDEIESALAAILDELATTGPTAEEFNTAEALLADQYNFVNDQLFLSINLSIIRFPEQDTLLVRDRFGVLDGVTRSDVTSLAAALYGDPASVTARKVLA